ncbi:cysteine protease ATG4C [Stigmatopora nigra]
MVQMETEGSGEMEKMKTKFMSMWHNVKYSWALKSKTSFSRNSTVLLLGKCYHFKNDEASLEASNTDFVMGNIEDFRKDFGSRIWLTYRQGFHPLPCSSLTSDCGWGCMLRAGQMMLAQALVLHFLGRDWTWSEALQLQCLDAETWTTNAAKHLFESLETSLHSTRNRPSDPEASAVPQSQAPASAEEADSHLKEMYHRTLVSWFGDNPSAQLGLHRLVHCGLTFGRKAGDWYGPAAVAHILKKAIDEVKEPALASITSYISQDCTVYSGDVIDSHMVPKAGQASAGTSDDLCPPQSNQLVSPFTVADSRGVIILIPVRLGGEKTNPEYFNLAKRILSLEYCIGIIGGKPKQACYFVGFQDDSLIYMDPHYCQSFVDVSTTDFPLQSYHCPSPKKMPFTKMDPSCTIGFYSRSSQDYEKISKELSQVLQPSPNDKYPAFTIVQGHGRDYDLSSSLTPPKREWPFIRDPMRTVTTAGDFVLL